MSSNIEMLMTGYAEWLPNRTMRATGSCCLVLSGGRKILFDTMGPWQRDTLLEKLTQFKIHQDDIDLVVCSHSHADHIGNLNLFTKCKHQIVGVSVYHSDLYETAFFEPLNGGEEFPFRSKSGNQYHRVLYGNYEVTQNIHVEPTPGHTPECVSMLIQNCDTYGTLALVGDLFEREEDVKNEDIWISAGSHNPRKQRLYREYIHDKVDYIVPGHGPIFKTTL